MVKQDNNINNFINCVNENFKSLIMFKTSTNKSLDNQMFKFIILQLKDSYERIADFKIEDYRDFIEDFDFFKKVLEMTKSLSNMAKKCLGLEISLEEFENEIDTYCSISEEWLVKYSLYLK